MTDMSYYPPTADQSGDYPPGAISQRKSTYAPDTSGPILVAVPGPAAQRRATVAFQVILAIPHFVVLYVLGVAAAVVAVIGWLGALVSGRLPSFAATYLSGYTRWYCGVAAYLLLLTDAYPPFSLSSDEGAYPVRVAVSPGRLNRLAVAVRVILAIPAAVVSLLLVSGVSTIVIVIAWLAALVAGKLPGSLHQAFAAVLRYTIRYYGYLYLLTDAYPAGLFGDAPGPREGARTSPGDPRHETPYSGYETAYPGHETAYPGYGTPEPSGRPWPEADSGYAPPRPDYGAPGYSAPGYSAPGYGAPPGYREPAERYGTPGYGQSGYGQPAYGEQAPGYGPPRAPRHRAWPARDSERPAGWQLILAPGAKRLVGLILVLGLLTVVGAGVSAGAAINSAIQRDREINQLNAAIAAHNNAVASAQQDTAQVGAATTRLKAAHAKLGSALNDDGTSACATITCFDASNVADAHATAAFGRAVRAISLPAGATAAANKLVTTVTADEAAWMYMSRAVSFTDGVNRATRAESAGKQVDQSYSALVTLLTQEATELKRKAAALDQDAATLYRRAAALNVPVTVFTSRAPSSPSAE